MPDKEETLEEQTVGQGPDEQTNDEQDETKIPTDPIPPPIKGKDLPIAITGQIAQAIGNGCHIDVFDGDPAGAKGIVQIIPEEAEETETSTSTGTTPDAGQETKEDTEPPPPSVDGADLFDQSIFCNLRKRPIVTAMSPPDSTPPSYRPAATSHSKPPPDSDTIREAAMYVLNRQKKPSS